MTRWVCPACDREFARTRQSHVRVPGCTVEETFAPRPGPEARSLSLALVLPRRAEHPLVARTLPMPGGHVWHLFKPTRVEDVGEPPLDLMEEAHDG
ncbi:hypothetical protein [Nonomuraea gerenzanensis]|uniref:Uncharacterized protein n=1 Tax=Nonomuraea gerenzanensis TaxID=93944 RepID=A0A1M4EIH1_9ACTN|nr:hypothetical protein [Nonomuraea gerenzanensis]UBU10105.1 hypothetical protein LCN96_37920 [Nonomuraea gerenzanensis]SBO98478.1 hypothetical protein BN4615_P7994 [Nonomuraea gerenzanensis]